ncbi:hypothetical protein INR49_007152 [Caranx melampygus]|nr:hypothetical protein INR49_007152 [Caranx melampygus]
MNHPTSGNLPHLVLGHVPAALRRPVSRGFLDELQPQARVRDDVHHQLGRPVREQRLAAKLTAELRVNVNDLHHAVQQRSLFALGASLSSARTVVDAELGFSVYLPAASLCSLGAEIAQKRRKMCAVQLLRVSVHERISAAAEDFLLQVEKGEEAAEVPALRALLTERLTAAAEEIVGLFEETVAEYEDRVERSEREICRQRRLLDAVLKPEVKLHRAELLQSENQNQTNLLPPDPVDLNQSESEQADSEVSCPPTPRSPSPTYRLPVSPNSSVVNSDGDLDSDWVEPKQTLRSPRKKKRGRPPLAVRNKRKRTTPAQSFICHVCGRALQGKGFLLKHVLQDPDRCCGLCGNRYESASSLSTHLRSHLSSSPAGVRLGLLLPTSDPDQKRVEFLPAGRRTELCTGMALTEAPPRCGLRALTEAVSEQLRRLGEEVLELLEEHSSGPGSSGGRLLHLLRRLLIKRLAAAAERIVGLLEREVEKHQRQLERQSRLLEAVLSPVVRLNRTACRLRSFIHSQKNQH